MGEGLAGRLILLAGSGSGAAVCMAPFTHKSTTYGMCAFVYGREQRQPSDRNTAFDNGARGVLLDIRRLFHCLD